MEQGQHLSVLLEELQALCNARKSGTLLIVTDDNSLAQFLLEDGMIVAVSFKGHKGEGALQLISKIAFGRARFHQRTLLARTPSLPSTEEILLSLGSMHAEGGTLGLRDSPPRPVSPRPVSPRPERRSGTSPSQAMLTPEIRAMLQSSLASVLGPIASLVCAERLAQVTSLEEALDTLTRAIADPADARRFRDLVLGRRDSPPRPVSPRSERPPGAPPSQAMLAPAIRAVLQASLAAVIGPMASLVCAECLAHVTSLEEALQALSREIPDPANARRFRELVRRAL